MKNRILSDCAQEVENYLTTLLMQELYDLSNICKKVKDTMNAKNYIPYEISSDFCYTEKKIADILMTYTKNRKQEPHPLYYKALAAAVKKMFVRFEESLADESFGDFDDLGEIYGMSLDVRDLEQFGIASYVEAQMLAPLLGNYFSSLQPYGEKVALKYGFFEQEPNELGAVTALLEKAFGEDSNHHGRPSEKCEKYARFLIDVLDRKMEETVSWNPNRAEKLVEELRELCPKSVSRCDWPIVVLDLYEWFCLKNNLTFFQFPSLYDGSFADYTFRVGAYALRYPSEQNRFTDILSCLQEYSRKHPGRRMLKNLENEDDAFLLQDACKPAEYLAKLAIEYQEKETDPSYHLDILEVLADLVESSDHHPFFTIPNEEQMSVLYHEVCRCLGIEPVLNDDEINQYCQDECYSKERPEDDEKPSEYIDRYLQKWVKEQDEDKKAWIVKTSIDAYADCLESGLTVEEVCSRVSQDVEVSDNNHRADLFARLQNELAGAFEPKLATHVAYAIFVRMVAEQYSETPAEGFKLRYSVAHTAFQDGEYCGEMPSAPDHLHAVLECTRSIFPDEPLIANQLASKISTLAMGVFAYGYLQRISHHYFLAGEIKHLLASARSACDNSGPVQRIARLHGYRGDHVYANDIRIIDTLYRAVCAGYRVQPCVDAERVV